MKSQFELLRNLRKEALMGGNTSDAGESEREYSCNIAPLHYEALKNRSEVVSLLLKKRR
jgi:hypothetical protein